MQFRALLVVLAMAAIPGGAAPALDRQFQQTVRPFVAKYCIQCHSGQTPAAQFDLKAYSTLETGPRDYPRWARVLKKRPEKEIPPKPVPPPPEEARQQVIDWI